MSIYFARLVNKVLLFNGKYSALRQCLFEVRPWIHLVPEPGVATRQASELFGSAEFRAPYQIGFWSHN